MIPALSPAGFRQPGIGGESAMEVSATYDIAAFTVVVQIDVNLDQNRFYAAPFLLTRGTWTVTWNILPGDLAQFDPDEGVTFTNLPLSGNVRVTSSAFASKTSWIATIENRLTSNANAFNYDVKVTNGPEGAVLTKIFDPTIAVTSDPIPPDGL
jgi:hypothetical protein